jgi:hypothetical protein
LHSKANTVGSWGISQPALAIAAILIWLTLPTLAGDKPTTLPSISLLNGHDLGHWKASDFAGAGEAHVENGSLILPMGDRLTGVTWTGHDFPKNDYEITLEARRVDGSDFFCGLTFPVGDSCASLILGGWGGSLCGISSLDGEDASHNDTRTFQRFKNGVWYKVRMRVTPDRLQAWVDKKQIVDVKISGKKIDVREEIAPSKPLGIASFQTTAEIRDVHLTPIGGSATNPSR